VDLPLEAEASIDVFGGQRAQALVNFAVVLDKDDVPDFENVRIVLVDEVRGVALATNAVIVDLSTGTTRAAFTLKTEINWR